MNISHFLHYIDKTNEFIGKIFSFLIIALLVVVLYEAMMRYVFCQSTIWAFETSLYIFGFYVLLGGAYTLLYGSHVNVDVVYSKFSPRTRAIIDIVTFAFCCLFLIALIWKGWELAWRAIHLGQRTDSVWAPVLWPSRLAIPIGAFLLLSQALAKFVRDCITAMGMRRQSHNEH